ncbi:MAG: hypothetical protein M1812_004231 [Candelaria pacifica]|nr:MAG: hypothetical protein M1812_004231 [Candelaria pacifica]
MTRIKHERAAKNRALNKAQQVNDQKKANDQKQKIIQEKAVEQKKKPTKDIKQVNPSTHPEVQTPNKKKKKKSASKKAKLQPEGAFGPPTKSESIKRDKEAAKNRLLRAKMKNEKVAILGMPQEVYSNIFPRLSTGDQYRCMQACSGLYIGVQATLYQELELVYTTQGVRPAAGQPYPKDAVDDKNLSKKKKRKKIRLDPKTSKTFQCFRINTVHTKKRLNSYLPHVKTLSVKEPYASWHTSTFEKSFEDFPEGFQFTNLSGFKYEAVKSVIRMQEMIDTLKFLHSKLPAEETTDVEVIRGIVLREKLAERIAQNNLKKAEAQKAEAEHKKAEKKAAEKAKNGATEGEESTGLPKILINGEEVETRKEKINQVLADIVDQMVNPTQATSNAILDQSLGKRKATFDEDGERGSKKLQVAPSIFGPASWSWSNLSGVDSSTEEGAVAHHKPEDHSLHSLKRKIDQDQADGTELSGPAKKTKTGEQNTNDDDLSNGDAAKDISNQESKEPSVQDSPTGASAIKSGKRKADDANLEDYADQKKSKTSESTGGDIGYATELDLNASNSSNKNINVEKASEIIDDEGSDDEDGLITSSQTGRIPRRRMFPRERKLVAKNAYERPAVLPHYMSGGLGAGDDIDALRNLRWSLKKLRALGPDELSDSDYDGSEKEDEDGSYDDGVEDYEDGDDPTVQDKPIVLSRLEAAGEVEITDMLNLEDEEKEELLKDVVLPKSMMVQGLCVKRLELKNLGAVGQRLLWTIAELFPGVTSLNWQTGPKGAARRWLLGPFNESFRNFRHLRKLHTLTTNYTVYIPTSSVPVDYDHAPIPDKRQVKMKTQPKAASKKKKWKKQIRPMERAKLFLDRVPRQFGRRFTAMVCRDQWLIAQKFILREVGKCFATVEEGGNGNALPMNHLAKLTFEVGETRKHPMTVDIDRSSDACLTSRDPSLYHRKGMKLTAEIPYDFLFLGVRPRKEFKKASPETIQSMRAETEAEEEDAARLKEHGNKGHVTWYSADLARERGPPQPFNHYNLHKTRRDFDYESLCRYVSWDW